MSDIADIADGKIERRLTENLALQAARFRASQMVPDCHCHFCDESIPVERLFCGVECRDDYELLEAAQRRAGRWPA